MFWHVSVILPTRGSVCPSACWDAHPPGTRGRHPLGPQADPPGPEADQPPPQDQRLAPPGAVHVGRYGRCVSYWNAFLCKLRFSCAIGNELYQWSLRPWNVMLLHPLISNFTFTNIIRKETTKLREYKVGNIANFVCLWKTGIVLM